MVSLKLIKKGGRSLYTFFDEWGRIIELPTRWMRALERDDKISPNTVELYAKNLTYLLDWIARSGRYARLSADGRIKALSRIDIEDWLRAEKERGLSPATVHNREAAIKTFLRWTSTEKGLDSSDLLERVYKGDENGDYITSAGHDSIPKSIAPKEVISLLNGYHNEAERCLVHLVYDTGVRISEAQRLTRSDLPDPRFYPDGAKYLPLNILGSKGRGGDLKERIAIMSRPVLARVRRYHNYPSYRFAESWSPRDPDKPCFLTPNSRRVKYSNAVSQLKAAAERAGLDPDDHHYHRLRHGAAYSLLRSELGGSFAKKLSLVRDAFGHVHVSSTDIYTSIPPDLLSEINGASAAGEKYEEAKEIAEATSLPLRKHTENRGHSQPPR